MADATHKADSAYKPTPVLSSDALSASFLFTDQTMGESYVELLGDGIIAIDQFDPENGRSTIFLSQANCEELSRFLLRALA